VPKVRPAELSVCDNAGSFLQSAAWGRFKAGFGWTARAFLVEWEPGLSRPLLVLCRKIAPGVRMAYAPLGPEPPDGLGAPPGGAAAEIARGIRPHLPPDVAFVRFDPPWSGPDGGFPEGLPPPFRRAAADVQPPDTVVVDLSPSPEDILAAMKPKWRYNIGLAEKRGVSVDPSPDSGAGLRSGLGAFHGLLAETARRDGISMHGLEYYEALFGAYGGEPQQSVRLYVARHGGERLAAAVVLFRGEEATYLYGASSNDRRNLMAPYALQWRAMRDAKEAGCLRYDLFGIPPDENPDHPMAGLYRFKTGFGGAILHRPGSWDFPYRPARCALFALAESLRQKLRAAKKRAARGRRRQK